MSDELFSFETYVHSCEEKEYARDVRKKNLILKYINILTIDHNDKVSLKKITVLLCFFRNIFCREECIRFFCSLSHEEQCILSCVFMDLFVITNKGFICEYDQFFIESMKLYKVTENQNNTVLKNWKHIKQYNSSLV